MLKLDYVRAAEERSALCAAILADLPDWFGLPEANEDYRRGVRDKVCVEARLDGLSAGFLSLKRNNEHVLEIYVMGVRAAQHRRGIGAALVAEAERFAQREGFAYLEVKTLDESRESEEYRRTRLFYRKVGFLPFDVLENEWGPDNPCLIMIKPLGRGGN